MAAEASAPDRAGLTPRHPAPQQRSAWPWAPEGTWLLPGSRRAVGGQGTGDTALEVSSLPRELLSCPLFLE